MVVEEEIRTRSGGTEGGRMWEEVGEWGMKEGGKSWVRCRKVGRWTARGTC